MSTDAKRSIMLPATEPGKKPHLNLDHRPPHLHPVVIEVSRKYEGQQCAFQQEYEGHLKEVLIPNAEILSRTKELAKYIHDDYRMERPVLLCVLKGASVFFHHLLSALQDLNQGFTYEFIRAESYEGTESKGVVELSGLDYNLLKEKHVVIVEDIVDTGTTIAKVVPTLEAQGKPKSVTVCTLLEKRIDHERHRSELNMRMAMEAKYTGFSIPNRFVIGFGLDYNERYRDLKDIWVISDAGVSFEGEM